MSTCIGYIFNVVIVWIWKEESNTQVKWMSNIKVFIFATTSH